MYPKVVFKKIPHGEGDDVGRVVQNIGVDSNGKKENRDQWAKPAQRTKNNKDVQGRVGNNCMKECRRFQQELDFIWKLCKGDFVLIQEHHLNAAKINKVNFPLSKEWMWHWSEAFGEFGRRGGVEVLKRRLPYENHRCKGTDQRASDLQDYLLETNPDRCCQHITHLISQTRDHSSGYPFMSLFQMQRNC